MYKEIVMEKAQVNRSQWKDLINFNYDGLENCFPHSESDLYVFIKYIKHVGKSG